MKMYVETNKVTEPFDGLPNPQYIPIEQDKLFWQEGSTKRAPFNVIRKEMTDDWNEAYNERNCQAPGTRSMIGVRIEKLAKHEMPIHFCKEYPWIKADQEANDAIVKSLTTESKRF